MHRFVLVILDLGLLGASAVAAPPPPPPPPLSRPDSYDPHVLTRFAWGSCSKQFKNQTRVWQQVLREKPQLWLWAGDAMYAPSSRPEDVREAFAQLEESGYALMRRAKDLRIEGTWDDHDYGANDAGKSLDATHRVTNRGSFLDFLRVPVDSPRRSRDGLWSSHVFGPAGRRVKVILLDTRSHRSNHLVPSIGHLPVPVVAPVTAAIIRWLCVYLRLGITTFQGDVLGEAQWAWLAAQLQDKENTELIVLVSSIQVLTTNPFVESWGHFPAAKRRLVSLLQSVMDPPAPEKNVGSQNDESKTQKPTNVLMLSGDVHHGEILGGGQHVLEATSSGLTHSCAVFGPVCDMMLSFFSAHRESSSQTAAASSSATNETETCTTTDHETQMRTPAFDVGKNIGRVTIAWTGEGSEESNRNTTMTVSVESLLSTEEVAAKSLRATIVLDEATARRRGKHLGALPGLFGKGQHNNTSRTAAWVLFAHAARGVLLVACILRAIARKDARRFFLGARRVVAPAFGGRTSASADDSRNAAAAAKGRAQAAGLDLRQGQGHGQGHGGLLLFFLDVAAAALLLISIPSTAVGSLSRLLHLGADFAAADAMDFVVVPMQCIAMVAYLRWSVVGC